MSNSPHAILAPSSAARRMSCPGSRAFEQKYPREDSEHSREGNAAHWFAAQAIDPKTGLSPLLESYAPNGLQITEDMIAGADLYQRHIYSICPDFLLLHIEEPIDISIIHPLCSGTPDCFVQVESELHIFDYKFGYGQVEVFENWQLLEYAAGVFAMSSGVLNIHLHIIQPRGFHRLGPVRSWVISNLEMQAYISKLQASEKEAASENARLNPSENCDYCSARHVCPALQNANYKTVDSNAFNTPFELTPKQLGVELRLLKDAQELLEARITGLEQQAIAEIKSGKRVPYFRLDQSYGRKRWTKPLDEILALGDLMEVDLRCPLEAITPSQAIKAGIDVSLVESFSETPKGALKLIKDNAERLFSHA